MKRSLDESRFMDLAGSLASSLAEDVGEATRKRRFKKIFGVSASVCAKLWILLAAHLGRDSRPVHLLWTLFFLKHYSVEEVNSAFAQCNEKTYRKWTWLMVEELAKLELVSGTVGCCCYVVEGHTTTTKVHLLTNDTVYCIPMEDTLGKQIPRRQWEPVSRFR
jgi:hypothetical protein